MNSILDSSAVILLRVTALLALGWAAHWFLRERHARWRLIIWRSLLCLSLAVPLTIFFPVPVIHLPVYEILAFSKSTKIVPKAGFADQVPIDRSSVGLQETPVQHKAGMMKPSAVSAQFPQNAVPWRILLLAAWFVGSGCAAIRLLRLQIQLGRIRAASPAAGQALQERSQEIQARLGVVRNIALCVSNSVCSPFACGLLQPMIVLPQKLAHDLPADEVSALLAHEIAHFRQHDLFWCVAWRLTLAVFWFHPLVWRIPAAHSLACEEEADRIASKDSPEPGNYPRLLARLVMRVQALSELETQLVLNGTSRIAQRLRHLQQGEVGDWNWKQSAAGLSLAGSLFLLATLCEFSMAGATAPAQGEGKSEASASSGKSTAIASSSHIIKIRALIDGADMVKIQGNKVWYEHESWELPGRWSGRDEDTLINEVPWHPVWRVFVDRSKPFGDLQPAFAPTLPAEIELKKLTGRGTVKITELPNAENQETLGIRIDNRPAIGADSYELSIGWTKDTVKNLIKINASIFGAVTVKIQGNQVWFEQESWQWENRDPRKWGRHDEPTLINEKPWHPVWLGEASNSKSSDPYFGLQPAFAPKNPASIKLTKIAGRGDVEISQLPTPENRETLSVHLDDSSLALGAGADWYEVAIEWQ